MNKNLIIVCFLWGEWFNRGVEYVNKLQQSLQKYVNIPYTFCCLTNKSIEGINCKPLLSPSNIGNLRKLALYNPSNNFKGQILAIDLDVLIINDITELSKYRGDMCIRGAFWARPNFLPDGDIFSTNSDKWIKLGIWNWINNNIKLIEQETKGAERKFYQQFYNKFWNKIDCLQTLFPDIVASYKKDNIIQSGIIPKNTKMISFHGHPKIHECDHDIVKDNWK